MRISGLISILGQPSSPVCITQTFSSKFNPVPPATLLHGQYTLEQTTKLSELLTRPRDQILHLPS